jgi:hypothetical protein
VHDQARVFEREYARAEAGGVDTSAPKWKPPTSSLTWKRAVPDVKASMTLRLAFPGSLCRNTPLAWSEALDLAAERGPNRRRRIVGLDVTDERHPRVARSETSRDAPPVRVLGEVRDDHVRTARERAVATAQERARVAEARARARCDGVARVVQGAGRENAQGQNHPCR